MDNAQEFIRLKTELQQKTGSLIMVLEDMSYKDIHRSEKRIQLSAVHSAALTSYAALASFIYDNIMFDEGNDDLVSLQ